MLKENVRSKKSGYTDYTLITIEENHALELKNETLIERLNNTINLMKEADIVVNKLSEKELMEQEWQLYLKCDPLPEPHRPELIRKFFSKSFYFDREAVEVSFNWQLAQDERSVLTQDIDAVDLTGRTLREGHEKFGEIYSKHVADTITIINRIKTFLDKPTKDVSETVINELREVKRKAYVYIIHFIDSLTSRVLCSETAYMDPIDATTAQYAFHGTNFDIHIWTYLNLPIYLDPVDTPFKIIHLSQIRTKLIIPFSVLCENMVIRGTHSNFDNFSPHARYYTLPGHPEEEIDLSRCKRNEWKEQMVIQAEVKAKLTRTRVEFDEMMRLKAEEEEAKARLRKKEEGNMPTPEKSKKSQKPHKDPQTVEPNQVPIVLNDFLKRNQKDYEQEMESFNPESFRLLPGEVNLRKYQILGGVYQLQSLGKPRVTNFPKLIMTWYTPNVRIEMEDPPKLNDPNSDIAKFFEIQFDLPECYCYWGEPIPCLFEEATTEITDMASDPHLTRLVVNTPVIINDFNLHELFNKPMMYDFIESTIPLTISSFKLPDFHDEEEDKKKAKATLGRSKLTAEEKQKEAELAMKQQMLSFETQNCPERLFPLFKKVLPVIIMPLPDHSEGDSGSKPRLHPYENFSDFMAALQSIKDAYRTSTFKDRLGKPIKIVAEKYDRNIRRPRKEAISSRYMVFDEEDKVPITKSVSPQFSDDSGRKASVVSEERIEEQVKRHHPKTKHKKGAHKQTSKPKSKEVIVEEEVVVEDDIDPTTFSKWSTSSIRHSTVRVDQKRVTIWTDRLGTFGFAFNRYQHFPFKNWTLQPFENDPEEVELAIVTENVMFRFYITPKGYKVCASDFVKYHKNRKIYLEITEPLPDLKELKMRLQEKFLNVFPERDAAKYIEGYFSMKHSPAECHTYDCMSLYAKNLKFFSSIWNKLSDRRTMILRFGELRDNEEDMFQLKISPEDVVFVDIKELCTELEVISLGYTKTWRNLEWYPDLNHLIMYTFNNALDMRTKDPHILYYLRNLLKAIRPFSCS